MEIKQDCECLFCQRSDLNLYEINFNSILIDSDLIDFQDLISEIFFAKINEDVVSFICEECKDLMTQFYIFKRNAKQNLETSPIFENLKSFLDACPEKSELEVRTTENEFIVSHKSKFIKLEESHVLLVETDEVQDETTTHKIEVDEEEEENEEYFEDMHAEEVEEEHFYEEENELSSIDDSEIVEVKEEDRMIVEILPEKVYQCECGVELGSSSELQSHIAQHKRNISTTCCGVGFKDYKHYSIHEKAHENFEAIAPQLPSFACRECKVMFVTQEDLSSHIPLCKSKKTFVIERRSAFEDHFLRSLSKYEGDEGEGEYSCGYCQKRGSERETKVHLLLFHTTSIQCPMENRYFDGHKQIRLFSEHIRNKHPELFGKSFLFNCRHCNQSFNSNFDKLAHMKICDKKQFECKDHCQKRFATEWLLKTHLKQISGDERFTCKDCGKRCVSRSDLTIHERSHTNVKPYECPICQKLFKTSANRSSHLDIHESEKKHECEICGEKFQTRPILRKHKKKHDEKYQDECLCRICGKKYVTRTHLLRHLKSNHEAPSEMTSEAIGSYFDEVIDSNER